MSRWGADIMKMLSFNEIYVRDIFARIGIRIINEGERRSPCEIVIRDDSLYDRLIAKGSLAFGNGYMHEQWDCAEACFTYVAHAIPQIDTAGPEKSTFRTETIHFHNDRI